MATIRSNEDGMLVEVSDAYGSYYYLADSLGDYFHGGWTSRDAADEAFDANPEDPGDADSYPPTDVNLDSRGRRLGECAYCRREVVAGEVPDPDDDAAWEELADQHDDDCEWVATRAHRRDPVAEG